LTNIVLSRFGGLGDLLMVLGAAKAMAIRGNNIIINTAPKYRHVALACPYVSSVICDPAIGIDLGGIIFGSSQCHQIDAYLEFLGLDPESVPPAHKEIEFRYDKDMDVSMLPKDYVLVHTPTNYDKGNRTAGREHWQKIITALANDGHNVCAFGNPDPSGKDHVYDHSMGTISVTDVLMSASLIHKAKAVISVDSGPVQIAAATDTPIIATYGVTKSEFRLPFRHGKLGWNATGLTAPCFHHPCYKTIIADVTRDVPVFDPEKLNAYYGSYCPAGDFRCTNVSPVAVVSALNALLEQQ
jgi:ADP-heptose:LPS heptosyltransferase